MSENKKEFDYEGYSKSLEKVLDGVTKDYWASYIDINRHQVAVGRTYLWVSAALMGVYAAGFKYFDIEIVGSWVLGTLCALTLVLAFLAFGICLYAIPARKGYKTIPLQGWGEFSHEAYRLLKDKSEVLYPTFLGHLISKIDTAFEFNFRTNQRRALLLRVTSWLLIASFCVAGIAAVGASFKKYQPNDTSEVSKMTEETDSNANSSQSSGSETQSTPAVPEPPPPANIGGTVQTHSVKPPASRQTFTEGVEKK